MKRRELNEDNQSDLKTSLDFMIFFTWIGSIISLFFNNDCRIFKLKIVDLTTAV